MKLRHLLFLLLLLSGIVPLAVSSVLLISQNRELLVTQETDYLTRSAEFLSVELNAKLGTLRHRLEQLGGAVAGAPGESLDSKLRQPWVTRHLQDVLASSSELVGLRLLNGRGEGPQVASTQFGDPISGPLVAAFEAARAGAGEIFSLVVLPGNLPVALLAVPMVTLAGEPLYVEGVLRLPPLDVLSQGDGEVSVFLVDREGAVLWSQGSSASGEAAIAGSDLVRDFVQFPANMTRPHRLSIAGREVQLLARISPVAEAGWGVVIQKPVAEAFLAVRKMVLKTAASTVILVVLALLVAVLAARKLSEPIQRLTETSHEIAAGNFGKRVEVLGLGSEMGQLASDFNRMSSHVEQYVEQLRAAARANRELFVGSMRAFVAAIDAKDPYTRGHSERVATHSRTIARFLGLDEGLQDKTWVGSLLHDVGKIGIEDRILLKGGVLSDEEYEEMKRHPVIGEEIMSRIEQLKEMLPVIRWHHEAWNGKGYPDGLSGQEIPLMARITGVADTFDAITTNRPYQTAYEPTFAVETIQKLAGVRFDPKVVTAFLAAYEAGEIQIRRDTAPAVPTAAAG